MSLPNFESLARVVDRERHESTSDLFQCLLTAYVESAKEHLQQRVTTRLEMSKDS